MAAFVTARLDEWEAAAKAASKDAAPELKGSGDQWRRSRVGIDPSDVRTIRGRFSRDVRRLRRWAR